MKSRQDLLNEARQHIPEMSVGQLREHLEKNKDSLLLDVRGLDEWEMGHIEGAVHIARGHLEVEAESRLPDKAREIVVYCAAGVRSLLAAMSLKELGYERVVSMADGFEDWESAHFPVERPPAPEDPVVPGPPELLQAEIAHLEQLVQKKKLLLSQMS